MSDSNWYGSSAQEQQPEVSSLWQQPSDPAQDAQQSYAPPSYGQPSYGQPSYDQQPTYGQPGYDQPAYGQPSYAQQPSTQQPDTQHQGGQHQNGQHHHNGQHQNGQQPTAPVYGQPTAQVYGQPGQVQYGDPSVPYVTNPYGQPVATGKRKWSGLAIAGFIAGLVVLGISLFSGFVYIGVLPIMLNVRGLMDVKRNHKKGKPLAIIGLVLTGIGIIFALINIAS